MAHILLVKVQPQVVTAKCSEPQVGISNGMDGRSGASRRNYMETKEMHKANTVEDKQKKMKELETYMKELADDITEMISDASPEEKTLLKNKLNVLVQKI